MSEATSNTVQERPESLPVPIETLMEDAGAGGEEVRGEDVQIPTLVIVQKSSPQIDRQHAAYVEGAEPGDIVETLTGGLWHGEEGIGVIPAHFRPVINHVQPKPSGSPDYLGTYSVPDIFAMSPTVRSDDGRWNLLEDGTALMQVAQHFVLPMATLQPVVVRMKRSGIQSSKRLNSLLEGYQPLTMPDGTRKARPRYAIRVLLETRRQEKDGNVYWTWEPNIIGNASEIEYHAGRDLHAMVKAGEAVAMPETDDETVPF